jgi:hypothetical protein
LLAEHRHFTHNQGQRDPGKDESSLIAPFPDSDGRAVVDFVFGLVKWHSVVAGMFGIVCGLN